MDKVHVDIGFGGTISSGGARYVLFFVDRTRHYNWVFALKTLSKAAIKEAFGLLCTKAAGFAKCFCCKCDHKLFDHAIKTHLTSQQLDIVYAAADRQSSNGLNKRYWKTIVHMSRAYLTKKQMPRNFWFHSIRHAAQMMNHILAKYNERLTSLFMLVHGTLADSRTWLPLFSVCYFHTKKDGVTSRSHSQAHTMDGIILFRDLNSNTAIVYNPCNKNFHYPESYCIDPHHQLGLVYSNI